MLLVSRTKGKKVIIGDDIVVQVVDIGRYHVKLGIAAPKDIAINREEVYHRILSEKGEVKSFATLGKEDRTVEDDDNIGNRITDERKQKRTIEIINRTPLKWRWPKRTGEL